MGPTFTIPPVVILCLCCITTTFLLFSGKLISRMPSLSVIWLSLSPEGLVSPSSEEAAWNLKISFPVTWDNVGVMRDDVVTLLGHEVGTDPDKSIKIVLLLQVLLLLLLLTVLELSGQVLPSEAQGLK